jgi:S1-C subfamily serine protease
VAAVAQAARAAASSLALAALSLAAVAQPAADTARAIDRVKPSVVAVGTFQQTRQPQFSFRGTGFVVGDGRLIATNAHVLPGSLDAGADPETLVVLLPSRRPAERLLRNARTRATSAEHDLALLQVDGPPLAAVALGDSAAVRDGRFLLFTGFPVGGALGMVPVTHQAMVGAVTPIVLPMATAGQLDARVIRQALSGGFDIFQLDAVAYPGNSGSPLYDPASGEVVGVINMILARATKESALPQPTGITYAIPVAHLRALLDSAAAGGPAATPAPAPAAR